MSFFKRISRGSRTNSYAEEDYEVRPRSQGDAKYSQHDSPHLSTHSDSQHNSFGLAPGAATKETSKEMYRETNGHHSRQNSAAFENSLAAKVEQTPDLLTRAFNEAVRPYTDKIEHLEAQVADLQGWVDQLEQQRNEFYSWIDKRGLRPDVPPTIAKAMDTQPDSATALNAQLDRKITIVNFDLHRLQDDLNDSISSAHFASAMSKFLPDISRLSGLPGGARYAFDLVLKLGGNLNSHGGLDTTANTAEAAADLASRREFYSKLDVAMVEVVKRRFAEGEDWPVQREIKRIEKTAAYLRNFGIEPYFPGTLDSMRRELEFRNAPPVGGTVPAAAPMPPNHNSPKY